MKVILSLFMALSCLFLFGSCKLGQSKYIHPAGRLPVARSSHTATLLKDGTILLVGGNIEIPYTNALQYGAQLYDPTTGKVEDLPPIRCPRIHHTTTLLPDGKVLIYGGTFSHLYGNKVKHDDCLRNVIEIYEPRTRKFDSLESSLPLLEEHSATLLENGKLLIAGGFDNIHYKDAYQNTVYEVDLKHNFSQKIVGHLKYKRASHAALQLKDGNVLIIGGITFKDLRAKDYFSNYLLDIELYNVKTHKSDIIGQLKTGRRNPKILLLNNNKIFIFGGTTQKMKNTLLVEGLSVDEIEIFNLFTHQSKIVATLPVGMGYGELASLPNGSVLLTGGDKASLYNPKTQIIESVGNLIKKRVNHTATLGFDNNTYIIGGFQPVERNSGVNIIDDVKLIEAFNYKEYLSNDNH